MLEKALNEILNIKDIKLKKDRNKKLIMFIGTYPLEILVECIQLIRNIYNYTFIDSSKKSSTCFKTSTINIAVKYLEDPYAYYANNVKILLDKVKTIELILLLKNL